MKKSLVLILALAMGLISASYAGHNKYYHSKRTTTMSMQQQAAWRNVVTAAQHKRRLSTFVTAVKAARLTSALQGRGPFTVFAPSNRAFARLPHGTLDNLLKPRNRAKLRRILLYHVIKGRYYATNIRPGWYRTAQGAKIMISSKRGRVFVNGNAKVRKTDIVARNGVIHVIDRVLMPPRG